MRPRGEPSNLDMRLGSPKRSVWRKGGTRAPPEGQPPRAVGTRAAAHRRPGVIICHCGVVSDRKVIECIQDGARTVANVAKCTGAGKGCGVCIHSLRRLLCEHEAMSLPTEVEIAAR